MLRLNVTVNNFFSHVGTEPPLPGNYQYFRGVKCFAQGHNSAEVGFKPPDLSLRSPTRLELGLELGIGLGLELGLSLWLLLGLGLELGLGSGLMLGLGLKLEIGLKLGLRFG